MKLQPFISLTVAIFAMAAPFTAAMAAPVDVLFEPPTIKIPSKAVCTNRLSDANLIARWQTWDRKALPEMAASEVVRDMNRLREINAINNGPIVQRIIELLPTVKKTYTAADALLDRIKLLVAADKTAEVMEQKLVARYLSTGPLNSKNKNTVANYIVAGLDPDIDLGTGLRLKVEAALEGNADAILDLVTRVETGEKIPGWTIDSKLAVNLAYGTLLGKLDSGICERIARIARDYSSGKIVVQNPALAVKWYQLAADLGDSYAAWTVAKTYLDGEDVPSDSSAIFKYINSAVEAGNPAAISALAAMYEEGAMVERNYDKALALYDRAIEMNIAGALSKKVKLLANLYQTSPQYTEIYAQTLDTLVASGTAPSWALMRKSRLLQEQQGFWASLEASKALLEKAVAGGDVEAKIDLGELILAENTSGSNQNRAIDLFAEVLKSEGEVRAVENLLKYYTCNQPNSNYESYWRAVKETMGNDTVALEADQAVILSPHTNALKIAALQTQSLYGRGSSMAMFHRYLEQNPETADAGAYWKTRASEVKRGRLEEMYAEFKGHLRLRKFEQARQSIKDIGNDFNPDAGLTFVRFLLENFPNDTAAINAAKQLLEPLAKNGFGRAIQLLLSLDKQRSVADFVDIMKNRGDMVSQLILAEKAGPGEAQQLYLRRAASSQRCDFTDAITYSEYVLRLDPSQADAWLELALRLSNENPWLEVKVADLYMAMATTKATAKALLIYRAGHEAQENSASFRLVKFYSDKAKKDYDPVAASKIFVDLINRSELKDIPDRLIMLSNFKQEIRRQVTSQLSIADLYRKAAEANQPVAMREYGKILRNGNNNALASEAFNWLEKAAAFGDAEGMFLVSQSYAFGMGVGASDKEARVWLEKSADAGFAEAIKLLSLVTARSEG